MATESKKTVPVISIRDNHRTIVGQASMTTLEDGRIEVNAILGANSNVGPLLPHVSCIIAAFEARLGD